MEPEIAIIQWQDALPRLEAIFEQASKALRGAPKIKQFITQEQYSFNYTMIYTMCVQKPPHNYSESCLNFVREKAAQYAMRPGTNRDMFIKYVSHCFKYLDHFYIKRMQLPELIKIMNDVMDTATTVESMELAERHVMKKAFLKWACDEELLGPTHADGGAAKARARTWWDENAANPSSEKKAKYA